MSTELFSCKDGLFGSGKVVQSCGCKGEKFTAGEKWPTAYRGKSYIQIYEPRQFRSIEDTCLSTSQKHQYTKYGNRMTRGAEAMGYRSADFDCGCFFQKWEFANEVGGSQMGWFENFFEKQDNSFCEEHQ